MLVVLLLLVPDLEEVLREAQPGRGRRALDEVAGGAACFHIAPAVPPAARIVRPLHQLLSGQASCCSATAVYVEGPQV